VKQKGERPEVRLIPGGYTNLGGRRITPDDLIEIGRTLAAESFNHRDCMVADEQGQHTADTLDVASVLERVLWRSVESFRIRTIEIAHEADNDVGIVTVAGAGDTWVSWSAEPDTNREAIERTFKRVVELVEGLPKAGWLRRSNAFTTKDAEEKRHLWQVWRQPESFSDWLLSGFAVLLLISVVGGVIVGLILGQ